MVTDNSAEKMTARTLTSVRSGPPCVEREDGASTRPGGGSVSVGRASLLQRTGGAVRTPGEDSVTRGQSEAGARPEDPPR